MCVFRSPSPAPSPFAAPDRVGEATNKRNAGIGNPVDGAIVVVASVVEVVEDVVVRSVVEVVADEIVVSAGAPPSGSPSPHVVMAIDPASSAVRSQPRRSIPTSCQLGLGLR